MYRLTYLAWSLVDRRVFELQALERLRPYILTTLRKKVSAAGQMSRSDTKPEVAREGFELESIEERS